MTLPWLKFNCAAWRADPRLRMCSLAARGLWIDLISYMHEGEPYGHLTIDGRVPDIDDIAALVARPRREVAKAIEELERNNVFSRSENGAIISRRMVRDKEKAERDSTNGKRGGNPTLKQTDNEVVNPQDKAKIREERGEKEKNKTALSAAGDDVSREKETGPKRYAFDGRVVRLSLEHFEKWTQANPNLDLRAELTARDAWLASDRATDEDRKNWFISTSKYLANRSMEARAKVTALRPEPQRGIAGII